MHRWQELVQVTQVVLAELAGGIALRFEGRRQRAGLSWQSDVGTRLADGRQARAQGDLAGNEVGPTRRATGLSIVIGEQHALRGELVEVWRLAGHNTAVVGADIEPPDVIAHDDDDVGFLVLRL